MKSFLFVLIFTFFLSSNVAAQTNTSFDCSRAKSTAENLICEDEYLSDLDIQLSNHFKQAKSVTKNTKEFQREAVEAWKWRELNCNDRSCLIDWFAARDEIYRSIIEVAAETKADDFRKEKLTKEVQFNNPSTDNVIDSKVIRFALGLFFVIFFWWFSKRVTPTFLCIIPVIFLAYSSSFNLWVVFAIIFLGSLFVAEFGVKNEFKRQKKHEDLVEQWIAYALQIIHEFQDELTSRRKQTTYVRNYGLIDDSKWVKEKEIFVNQILSPRLKKSFQVVSDRLDFMVILDQATSKFNQVKLGFSDGMDPFDYEKFVAEELELLGWSAKATVATGDQGVDVIAQKNGIKVAIQCKLYSNSVGNEAVQQILAGKIFSEADFAAVVSNADFTKSAQQIAALSNVFLLHHDDLANLDGLVF